MDHQRKERINSEPDPVETIATKEFRRPIVRIHLSHRHPEKQALQSVGKILPGQPRPHVANQLAN